MRQKTVLPILLFISFFVQSHPALAQSINDQYTLYTTKNGLPDGLVGSIIQDSSGFLWLATTGLARFDGHSFKTYRYSATDTNSLRENQIYDLFIDSKSRLWVLSMRWLYLYHPDGDWFEHFTIDGLSDDEFRHICAEENGQFVIAAEKSLYKFDIKQKEFSLFSHEGIQCKSFVDYKKDENGIEWIATDIGLFRYDPGTKKLLMMDSVHSGEKYLVSAIFLLPDGNLLASTYYDGLLLINQKTNAVTHCFHQGIDPKLIMDNLCKLNDSVFLVSNFISKNDGVSGYLSLSFFNWRKGTFTDSKPTERNNGDSLDIDKKVYSVFRDKEGIIWLGGVNLAKYDFNDFNVNIISCTEKRSKEPSFGRYGGVYECSNGDFLLGGYTGMAIYDTSKGILNKVNDEKLADQVGAFAEDGRGNIWCHTLHGIAVFNLKDHHVENVKQYDIPGSKYDVLDLKIDPKGFVSISTLGAGLIMFDTAGKRFVFPDTIANPQFKLINPRTRKICIDHNGCTWISTARGINKMEKDGHTVKLYRQNKANSTSDIDWNVGMIREDKHGMIWFTTLEHGIGRIDPKTDSITFFSTAQGLPTCWYWTFTIDDHDNLWALSWMGVLKLNTITLQNELYSEDEGFPKPRDIRNIHFSKYTGLLYLLTPQSIFEIDTRNIDHHIKIPEALITGFSIFDKEKLILPGKEVNLNYNENFITIQFVCLLFHNVKQIKYAYKMEGIDADWVYCNFKRNASYTNLPPGHYSFMVKAQGPEGVWNKPTLLSIIIRPPYWQSWWFYLAEALLAAAFITWLVRLYTGRKLARQKSEIEKLLAISNERSRIASDMHDDLGSGLTSIRLLSEIANLKTSNDHAAKAEIAKIAKSAGSLSEHLREIIWTMNTRNDKLDDFIIYVRSYAVSYFDDSPIRFQFNRPDVIPELMVNGELRRNIFLCIKEALHNILKHSQATDASLTFSVAGQNLTVEIKDNGIGFDTTQTNKSGMGLNTMKERLNKFGGNMEIEGPNGTKLIFRIVI